MGLNLSLGGIVSSVLDPGKVVKDVVDAVLPEKLDVIADLAGAIVDFKTGRPLQGMGHLAQALKDLPQALADEKSVQGPNQHKSGGTPAFEPTPPPSRGNGSEGFDWKTVFDLFRQLRSRFSLPGGSPAPTAAPKPGPGGWTVDVSRTVSGTAGDWRGAPPDAASTKTPASSSSTTSSTAEKSSSAKETTKKEETADTKKATTDKKATEKTTTEKTTTEKATTEKKAASGTAVAKLNKISDEELMKMVRNGTIPDEVFDDPKAQMALQQRINHITEMTKLMTQLIQALHDVRMSVLHNVRA